MIRSDSSPRAVRRITGISLRERIQLQRSSPLMWGTMTSSTTRSGGSRSISCRAVSAVGGLGRHHPFVLEVPHHHVTNHVLVVDDQDVRGGGSRGSGLHVATGPGRSHHTSTLEKPGMHHDAGALTSWLRTARARCPLRPVNGRGRWRGTHVVPPPARTPGHATCCGPKIFTFCKLHVVFCRCLRGYRRVMAAALGTPHRCGTPIALMPGPSCPA